MMHVRAFLVLLFFCPSVAAGAADLPDTAAIIRHIDDLRQPNVASVGDVKITPYRKGVADEPSLYTLYIDGHGSNLLKALSLDQRGQKFLTNDKGIFFYAPRTHRAVRLTPLQSLRGQASIGDITRLHFAEDYETKLADPARETVNGEARINLILTAKNDQATYGMIHLAVREAGLSPAEASLFAASGRLLKRAIYAVPDAAHDGHIASVRYIDAIDNNKETLVESGKAEPTNLPASMFNPRSLEE